MKIVNDYCKQKQRYKERKLIPLKNLCKEIMYGKYWPVKTVARI